MRPRNLRYLAILVLAASELLFAQGLVISPSTLPSGTVGVSYSQSFIATGGRGPYSWSLATGSGPLPTGLSLSSAGVLSGIPSTAGTYSFTIQATDTGVVGAQIIGRQNYQVQINFPPLTIVTTALPYATVGTGYSQTLVATGGSGNYSWSVVDSRLPPGLTLSSNGVLGGIPTTAGNYQFIVAVSSSLAGSVLTATQAYQLTINSPPLTIAGTLLPSGIVGIAYSATLTASGGGGFYTWSVAGGSLPPGVTLSSNGVVSGTPSVTGNYLFIAQVSSPLSNGETATATRSFALVINPPPLVITTTQLPPGTVGVFYSQTLAATGGSGAYNWSLAGGALPAGFTLSTNGVLSGTTTSTGTFPLSVQVTSPDATGANMTATQSLVLTVNTAALAITTTQLPPGTVGVSYSQSLAATGGSGNYTWSSVQGTLPPGITLTPPGALTGTPTTAGSYSFTVQVSSPTTGGTANTVSRSLTLLINPPALTITTGQLADGAVGARYSQTLSATGGVPPYSWRVSSGTLPPGLTLDSSGVLGGIPTATGSFGITATVSDSAQGSAAKDFSLTIAVAALAITNEALPNGSAGAPYSVALAATGGVPPYAWSITAGAVPDGLALSASGAISGNPSAPGTFSFTVQVADSSKQTAAKAFRVTIVAGVKITTMQLSAGTAGASYSQQLTATGGTPPYTWAVDSGSLPGGLSLSTVNGTISGTPNQAGTFRFVIAVTDSGGGQDKASFAIVVASALTITTQAPLADGVIGSPYAQDLAAAGGTPPYQWSILSGGLPAGLRIDSSSGRITGTPSASGSFDFTIQVADSAKAVATGSFTINITAALTITSVSPLARGTLGRAYSQQLNATGGKAPYRWSSASALPGGLSLSSAGLLSGTPTAAGNFNLSISATDGEQSATKAFTLVIDVPAGPMATISGLPDTPAPATQPVLTLSIANVYPVEITGQVTLTFAPDSGPDDPNVQFTGGGRSMSFRVPAGSMQAVFGTSATGVQTGTVAGLITLTVRMNAAGVDITPSPVPTRTVRINRSAPVIVSASLSRTTSGFDLVIVGYSTSRDMTSATVGFSASSGVTLSSVSATVPLSAVFTPWYQSTASAQYGSQFMLRIPFTVQGTANAVNSVSVLLTNAVGDSATANAAF